MRWATLFHSSLSDVCTSHEWRNRAEGWEGPGGAGVTKRVRRPGIREGSRREGAEQPGSPGNEGREREAGARSGMSQRRRKRGGRWRRLRHCQTEMNSVSVSNPPRHILHSPLPVRWGPARPWKRICGLRGCLQFTFSRSTTL